MALKFTTSYLDDSIAVFSYYKGLAEKAMEQLPDGALFGVLDEESNSIALIVKHMTGNMRSRWTDFLTSDGEKSWRNRDSDFEAPPASREALMELWEQGWNILFSTLTALTDTDLSSTVTIRGEAHSAMQAVNRQVAHYSYHCGQIVFLAKHLCHDHWQCLSVPRGKSQDFNAKVASGDASQR